MATEQAARRITVYLNQDAFDVDEGEYRRRFDKAKLESDMDQYMALAEWVEQSGRYLGQIIGSDTATEA